MKHTLNKTSGVGVVVGRFQTPFLHEGHLHLIKTANKHHKLLILVGVHSIPGAFGEELDFPTRKSMLQEKFPNAMIIPLKNCATDKEWSIKLDKIIYDIAPFSKAVLYHGRDSFAPHYKGKHELKEIDEISNICATSIREESSQNPEDSEDFRKGVFYGLRNTFPRVNPTVDMAITRRNITTGKLELLLGKKPDGRGWRFPGGFVDSTDESAEDAAKREALEETGLYLENPEYVSSRQVADWRNTERSVVMTFFYHFEYQMGHAEAADDLETIKWVPIDESKLTLEEKTNIVPEHEFLLDQFFSFLTKKGKKQ